MASPLLWAPVVAGGLLVLFYGFFHRDPERSPRGEGMVSPADGRVARVEGDRLAIFMNVTDVHVNRAPLAGRVAGVLHRPGVFRPAFLRGEATSRNERNTIGLEADAGAVEVVQIAGFLARRIVCFVKEGERVERGQRLGMIRLGSRVEATLPPGYRWCVEAGRRVRAGETVVAVRKS